MDQVYCSYQDKTKAVNCINYHENTTWMKELPGWHGPIPAIYRTDIYLKDCNKGRLYIAVKGSDFWGGVTGEGRNFEVAFVNGKWTHFIFKADAAPANETGLDDLDQILDRRQVDQEIDLDETLSSIEDLAAYLDKQIRHDQ